MRQRLRQLIGGEGSVRAQLVRGASGSFGIKIVNLSLLLGVSVVLARLLGPVGLGYYAFALAVARVFATLATMGLRLLAVREIAANQAREEWALLGGFMRVARVAVILAGGLLSGAVAGYAALASDGAWSAQQWTLLIAAPLVLLLAAVQLYSAMLRGLGRILLGQLPQFVMVPALLLALVGVVYLLAGELAPYHAAALHIAAALIAIVFALIAIDRLMPAAAKAATPRYELKRWLIAALPLALATNLNILNNELSVLLLGGLSAPDQVGLYRIAQRGAELPLLALNAINLTIAPTASRLFTLGEHAKLQRMATGGARATLAFAAPIALTLAVGGPWILAFVFGEDFAPAAGPLAILLAGQLVNAAMGSVGLLLNMTGHERDTARGVGLALAVNIALGVLLIPPLDAAGAAIAMAAGLITWNVYLAVRLYRRTGLVSHALHGLLRRRRGD